MHASIQICILWNRSFLCLREYEIGLSAIFVRAGAGLDAWWPNWDAKPANLSHPGTICGAVGR